MKVPIQGGAPQSLTNIYAPRGIYWSENGTILMAPAWGEHGLAQISETDKNETVLTQRDSISAGHMYPQLLPGGEAILYTDYKRNIEDSRIMIRFLKSGEEEELIKGGIDGRYVPTGHIVFVRKGNLFAVPFDIDQMERGEIPVRILEGVMHSISEDVAQYSFSENGTLAYIRGGVQGTDRKLVLVDRTGKEQSIDEKLQGYSSPHFSPDGKKIVLTISANNDDIWTYDIANRYWTPLTTQGRNIQPIWTQDGNRIIFRSDLNGKLSLYWIPSEGGRVVPLLSSEYQQAPTATSPDGKLLAYGEFNPTTGWDIGIMPLDKPEEAYLLLETPDNETFGCFSPDGKYLAYGSDTTNREEIYVIPIDGPGGPWSISTEGGSNPVWAKNWELFFQNGEKVMAVDTEIGNPSEHEKPKVLFEKRGGFDVTSDGKRFLFIEPGESEKTRGEINVILNWFEELKERVPVD
jgi:serine/threonine-protein kinase